MGVAWKKQETLDLLAFVGEGGETLASSAILLQELYLL